MYIRKNFPIREVLRFSWFHIVWLALWGSLSVWVYQYFELSWLAIPWLPVSLIGTAVAFYLGFKNNSSYDRLWEARKIWGAIVNSSRSWTTMVKNFTSDQFNEGRISEEELAELRTRLTKRHIAWLYTLRSQLLKPAPWEKINGFLQGRINRLRIKNINKIFDFENVEETLERTIGEERKKLDGYQNRAAQLIDFQAQDLKMMREKGIIDDFRHMEMQRLLTTLYDHQGRCERIKGFPFPRQYGSISFYFIGLFIILLPFGMLGEFETLGEGLVWLTAPFTAMVGWVFIMMELVGDYSENPFENLSNDIPMYSMCRMIEIDLRQMIKDSDIPEPIVAQEQIMM